ncbi:hypothetical protein [Subtercola sp. RTI3]|nr:hypothetical protein [Subtercola sp. RTI3]MEA9987266.1 hypothetical protein [Subtercola sp. RTI3]
MNIITVGIKLDEDITREDIKDEFAQIRCHRPSPPPRQAGSVFL